MHVCVDNERTDVPAMAALPKVLTFLAFAVLAVGAGEG